MTRRKYTNRSGYQQGQEIGSAIADIIGLFLELVLTPIKWVWRTLRRRFSK